ncbi:MAG: cell division protein ZipA [Gammaproteobacteria bacterium]|nr:cell division protein ZipA [Gammaproteobacteria bacterium]
MESELRIILAVIGVIIIGVVAYDGYRKSQRKKQLKRSFTVDLDPKARDNQGFDLDGVGEVRVRQSSDSDAVEAKSNSQESALHNTGSKNKSVQSTRGPVDQAPLSETIRREPNDEQFFNDGYSNNDLVNDELNSEEQSDAIVARRDDFSVKEQINEDESMTASESSGDVDSDAADDLVEPELIFSLTLLANDDNAFHGQELLSQLIENGCRFGDMNIFHRFKAANSTKNKYFSVANAFNPGVFDLDNMQNESFKGISFFMGVPGPAEPEVAYKAMVEAARGIKKQLGGKIMDSRRSVFTEQTYQHDLEQINEYRRKTLTKH